MSIENPLEEYGLERIRMEEDDRYVWVYYAGKAENVINKLKAENDRLKKKMDDYHLMSDIRRAKIKELKRALWLARAERALEKIAWFKLWNTSISTMNPEDGARQEFDKWKKNLGKFLKRAEEYK